MNKLILAGLSYLVPTFVLGFVWHLVLFKSYYDALEIYRSEMIIPLGLLAMTLQGALFAWVYTSSFARSRASVLRSALAYGAFGAVLSWTFTTLAVAAKNVMTSVPSYLLIETGFTLVQWALVAALTALVFRALREPSERKELEARRRASTQ